MLYIIMINIIKINISMITLIKIYGKMLQLLD